MGKILQIRVSAFTYDDKNVKKRWPKLVKLAWEEQEFTDAPRGVLEMVTALKDRLDVGLLPDDSGEHLGSEINNAARLKVSLESALADWKPAEANTLSDKLEEALDELEKIARKM